MASNSETGHIKNVANLGVLNSAVTTMGTAYNPSNPLIAPAALSAKKTACDGVIKEAGTATIRYKSAVNERNAAYDGMSKLSTRIFAALESCGAKTNLIWDAKGIKDKIVGKQAAKPKVTNPDAPKKDGVSVSQMSFDNRKANFELLVALIKNEPRYNPNETELTVSELENYIESLGKLNNDVNDTLKELQHKKELRDIELYAPETGVVDLSKVVKKYVKSVVGTGSPTYKNIVKIKFTGKRD